MLYWLFCARKNYTRAATAGRHRYRNDLMVMLLLSGFTLPGWASAYEQQIAALSSSGDDAAAIERDARKRPDGDTPLDVGSGGGSVPTLVIKAELEGLRSVYTQMEEDRERKRQAVAARIAAIEKVLVDVQHQLEAERSAARALRSEYFATEKRLQEALDLQKAQYDILRAEYEELQAVAAEREQSRQTLADALAAERYAREADIREANETQNRLAQELVTEGERVRALMYELRGIQEEMERLSEQAQARFLELELERDEHAEALHTATLKMQALRENIANREALWAANQADLLQDIEARDALLRAERERFTETMQAMQLREQEIQEARERQEVRHQARLSEAVDKIAVLEEKLAVRDLELARARESMGAATLQRALEEIARMEQEFARLEADRKRGQQALQDRTETRGGASAITEEK